MKVANIIEDGRLAGPQRRITLVSKALKQFGVKTVVILPKEDSNNFVQELKKANVAWESVGLHRLARNWKRLLVYGATFFSDVFFLWIVLRRGNFDIVHVSGGAWQIKGILAGRMAGIPSVWHINDSSMSYPVVLVLKLLGRLAGAFIATSHRVNLFYKLDKKFPNKKVFYVQAPVDCSRFAWVKKKLYPKPVQVSAPVLMTIANINPNKGLETLINSLALVTTSFPTASLVIVGPIFPSQVGYFLGLKGLIKRSNLERNVIFLGGREDIPELLSVCDVFVCSSIAESGPMSVWEAMAAGCAVVSTDVGDVAHYIKNEISGFVVPIGAVQEMANVILKLLHYGDFREGCGEKAQEVANNCLDVAIVAKQTARVYQYVAEQRS